MKNPFMDFYIKIYQFHFSPVISEEFWDVVQLKNDFIPPSTFLLFKGMSDIFEIVQMNSRFFK
jgi:hypothetical protein